MLTARALMTWRRFIVTVTPVSMATTVSWRPMSVYPHRAVTSRRASMTSMVTGRRPMFQMTSQHVISFECAISRDDQTVTDKTMMSLCRCLCDSGLTGTNCDVDIDECASSPCLNGGQCLDEHAQYSCRCLPSYSGTNCQISKITVLVTVAIE